ncbi:protein kinase [Streptomyces sp. NPDC048566]|uniref:serine/threonine-protein kinase n=1 Tax=Streptomyces sp. NPDC048566 TaxID=3365569 RepID=UPI003722CE9C
MMEDVLIDDRFRMRRRIGSGGMGEVWSALDERMRRSVAVKLVHAPYGMEEAETMARFRREVQLAGRLSHQNIVTVHDWGEVVRPGQRPLLYLVMELVHGVSLRERLKESPSAWPQAVGWGLQIARALATAHQFDVIHRDVKPANVLLAVDGRIKVLDFGVAKFVGDTLTAHELTVTGAVLGSPPYMSPEQALGTREIDHRSDLYSLGCLLYHAVTGRPPFVGSGMLAVLRMHMEDAPTPPAALVEDLPEALNEIILRLLAKRPEDRPAYAADVHQALTAVLVDQAVLTEGRQVVASAVADHHDVLGTHLLQRAGDLWSRTARDTDRVRRESEALMSDSKEEAGRIIGEARKTAEEILADAADEARHSVAEAKGQAAHLMAQAETEAECRTAEVAGLLAAARARAEHLVAEARAEADRLLKDVAAEVGLLGAEARRASGPPAAGAGRGEREAPAGFPPGFLASPGEGVLAPASSSAGTSDLLLGTGAERPAGLASLGHAGFELVRRGYDRDDVDKRIALVVDAYERSMAQVTYLEGKIKDELALLSRSPYSSRARRLLQHGSQQLDACFRRQADRERNAVTLLHGEADPPYPFALVRRGYDPRPVDHHVTRLEAFRQAAAESQGTLRGLLAWLRSHGPQPPGKP